MYPSISDTYTLANATFEILFMLSVSFILGFLCAWLWKKSSENTQVYSSTYPTEPNQIDNLKLIEGVGPKIEELLNENDIYSFSDMYNTDIEELKDILQKGGKKFQVHNPTTWPDQAKLAMEGKWAELKEYQDILNGGR